MDQLKKDTCPNCRYKLKKRKKKDTVGTHKYGFFEAYCEKCGYTGTW